MSSAMVKTKRSLKPDSRGVRDITNLLTDDKEALKSSVTSSAPFIVAQAVIRYFLLGLNSSDELQSQS